MTKEKYPNPQLWLDIETCKVIYRVYKDLAVKAGLEAPIPEFDSRYPGNLESILGSVQFQSDYLGYDIQKTAAYYFVSFAKSQCFVDANKRLSVILTNVFLMINGHRLLIDSKTLRDMAIFVADKDSGFPIKKSVEDLLQKFPIGPIKN